MLLYDFTVEDKEKGFLVCNASTLDHTMYPDFTIFNYSGTLLKQDAVLYYKMSNDDEMYKPIATNMLVLAITKNNVFEFLLFPTSSLLTITVEPDFLDKNDLYVMNKRLEKTMELFILPKYTAIPCRIEVKKENDKLHNIRFAFPIQLKKINTVWSIM